jgi:C-terminal processing protease CtpA/Prc
MAFQDRNRTQRRQWPAVAMLALLIAGCGGGSAGSTGGATGGTTAGGTGTTPGATPTPTPTPTPTASACSLRSRQDWAAAQLNEWYLFPETLPAGLDPAPYATVGDYIDALTATARGQGRDRFFTYLTSIAEEDAFFASGDTAAFGIRIQTDSIDRRVFVTDAYEGAPALAAGIDRGAEITAIGTSAAALRSVAAIIAADGAGGISAALGPSTAGTTRTLTITDAAGTRNITISKANFSIAPVSSRFGAQMLRDGGERIGYINLRTFISTADPALRTAFANFRAQGITRFIIDLRYNGGGLVSTAELIGDLLGGNRFASDVLSYTTFRASKSSENETRNFRSAPQSVAPVRIAFIGTGGTASASELVINTFTPYLRSASGLIGANTFGKPVGQIALDRAQCDDRLRAIAFATQNADRNGDYFTGLAATAGATCAATDDLDFPMGDPREASTRVALDFLADRPCTPIGATARSLALAASAAPAQRTLLMPDRPDAAQREVPGTF